MGVVDISKLERTLQTNWTDFIDSTQIMRLVLEHVKNTSFPVINQRHNHRRQLQLTITKVTVVEDALMDLCVEFTVPKQDSVVIGTALYQVDRTGQIRLKESYGSQFSSLNPS